MIWLILGAAAIAAFAVGGFWASCVLGALEDEMSGSGDYIKREDAIDAAPTVIEAEPCKEKGE